MQKLIKILMPYVYSRPYVYSFWTRLVNPIQIRGADYARHTTANPPEFKKLSTPLSRYMDAFG